MKIFFFYFFKFSLFCERLILVLLMYIILFLELYFIDLIGESEGVWVVFLWNCWSLNFFFRFVFLWLVKEDFGCCFDFIVVLVIFVFLLGNLLFVEFKNVWNLFVLVLFLFFNDFFVLFFWFIVLFFRFFIFLIYFFWYIFIM